MQCPACDRVNDASARFCDTCGKRLPGDSQLMFGEATVPPSHVATSAEAVPALSKVANPAELPYFGIGTSDGHVPWWNDTYTVDAHKVFIYARYEAQRLKDHVVVPEHLLLGILLEPTCLGAQVLSSLGLDLQRARSALGFINKRRGMTAQRIGSWSPDAIKAVDEAVEAVVRLGDGAVGTEHLLLGILSGGGSIGEILASQGIPQEKLFAKVVDMHGTERLQPQVGELSALCASLHSSCPSFDPQLSPLPVIAGRQPTIVQAERFELIDGNGKGRIVLSVDDDQVAGLILYDEAGARRIRLGVHTTGVASIGFWRRNGRPGAIFGIQVNDQTN